MVRENTVPIFVADSLDALGGPVSGVVELPLHLDWTAARSYDLDNPRRVLTMYSTVLREAGSETDLVTYLDAEILKRVWVDLNIPTFVREVWENKHPALIASATI